MGLLNETFGVAGTAQSYFGGEWWLVGILLLLIFTIYFYAKGLPGESLAIFMFSGIILITIDNLFTISEDIIMTVIVFILIFVGLFLARALTR